MPTKDSLLNSRKPFKLLGNFTPEERQAFRDYLDLPHPNSSRKQAEKLVQLYERARSVDLPAQPVTKSEFLAGTTFPTSANAFDKLVSIFYDRMQEFLAFQTLRKDPIAQQQLAFRAYFNWSLEWKEIHRRYKEALRELGKLPQSSHLANDRWTLELDLATNANDRSIPQAERGYGALLDMLEANYATQKLRLLCAIANDQMIFASDRAATSAAPTLPGDPDSWPELARMYYYVYLLLIGQASETSMAQLHALLDAQEVHAATYPQADMLDLYGYLLNALARQVNQGDPLALERLSHLHDHLIHKGVLLENGFISAEHFKNVISVKLKTGEIAAARAHFEQLAAKISNDPDQNASRYNHALLLYAEQHLQAAAQSLENLCAQTGNLKLDQFYGLDLRVHLLKVYYDLLQAEDTSPEVWDATDEKMQRLLEAYKGYIERRKITEKRRATYVAFRKLVLHLYQYTYGAEAPTLPQYHSLEQLVQESGGSVRPWFKTRLIAAARMHGHQR